MWPANSNSRSAADNLLLPNNLWQYQKANTLCKRTAVSRRQKDALLLLRDILQQEAEMIQLHRQMREEEEKHNRAQRLFNHVLKSRTKLLRDRVNSLLSSIWRRVSTQMSQNSGKKETNPAGNERMRKMHSIKKR